MTQSNTIICTLFEGHYHFGVAALCNSLVASGFEGRIYAAYRGELPPWARGKTSAAAAQGVELATLTVTPTCELVFLSYDPPGHYTNFKPNLIQHLLRQICPEAGRIFYFDPDICVRYDWSFFEQWVDGGVALAEDATPPMPQLHPKRRAWRRIFAKEGFQLSFRMPQYANAGFIGLRREQLDLAALWQRVMAATSAQVGGLDVAAVEGGRRNVHTAKVGGLFTQPDQDSLNAAIEAYDGPVALLGQEVMGFRSGVAVMTHALGWPKPWEKNALLQWAAGHPPTLADLTYWKFADGPLHPHSALALKTSRLQVKLARLLGRFYRAYA